jgi:5'(3')-deoxyribonucleotidase/uncharacterized protein with PQ loop repeat
MSGEIGITVVGTLAAVCTTVAFVPQIAKIRRQGGRDLSYGMLGLYLAGVGLWLAYGLLIGARAVILANAAAALLVGTALALKVLTAGPTRHDPQWARRLRIGIDMDETICDSLTKHLQACQQAFGVQLSRRDVEGRAVEEAVPPEQAAAARDLVLEPTFFTDLAAIEGSRRVVRELAERHEVFIVTAAMEVPTSFAAKYAWLREHLPFIPPSHLVFCGDKGVLDLDVLIDDTPRHFRRFRGTPILFTAPHNLREHRFQRVSSWDEVRRLFLGSQGYDVPCLRSASAANGVSGSYSSPIPTSGKVTTPISARPR